MLTVEGMSSSSLTHPGALSYSVSGHLGWRSDAVLKDDVDLMLGMEERLPKDSNDRMLAVSESTPGAVK